ncbi:hypothetical protein SLEP1_g2480 [Rubroshorea leprosula]|uniref:Uncharacterized protein n=1 Tax=Rubroshorea leprosula TaxID=152421 RepID=A0AAV5HRH4_9ROSI|nr:hypothetical protein SLEP1_g2480 [Rubroshorea leprosula]
MFFFLSTTVAVITRKGELLPIHKFDCPHFPRQCLV